MQKIMFEHLRFGLEQAVIAGTKTMTRRRIHFPGIDDEDVSKPVMGIDKKGRVYFTFDAHTEDIDVYPKYQIGEQVAIAQCYKDADVDPHSIVAMVDEGQNMFTPVPAVDSEGWNNKMFVRTDLMPHVIEITDIKAERLQEISDEDCMKEGIYRDEENGVVIGWPFGVPFFYTFTGAISKESGKQLLWTTRKEALSELINSINGRGTWERNEWQFAYTFKLIK